MLRIHHIGGIEGLGPVEKLKNQEAEWIVYDADNGSLNKTEMQCHFINKCISDKDGEAIFYIMSDPAASSLLKPNENASKIVLSGKKWGDTCKVVDKTIIETHRLDTLIDNKEIPEIDFLSVDAQGADLSIIKSTGKYLKDVLGVICEVEFFPLYKNQPLFYEIAEFMYKNGFIMVEGYNRQDFHKQIICSEFLFIKSPNLLNEEQKEKLNILIRCFL